MATQDPGKHKEGLSSASLSAGERRGPRLYSAAPSGEGEPRRDVEEATELLLGVELPRELSIAMDLFQQNKQRAARAWVRSYLGNLPPEQDAEVHLSILPPTLREVVAGVAGRSSQESIPSLRTASGAPPRWFAWGVLIAATFSLMAQMGFLVTWLKHRRDKRHQAKAHTTRRVRPKVVFKDWDPTLTFNKIKLLCAQGMHREGLSMIRKALDRGFREAVLRKLFLHQQKLCHAAPHWRRGRRLFRRGDYAKARDALLTALSLAPHHEDAREYLDKARKALARQGRKKPKTRQRRRRRRK